MIATLEGAIDMTATCTRVSNRRQSTRAFIRKYTYLHDVSTIDVMMRSSGVDEWIDESVFWCCDVVRERKERRMAGPSDGIYSLPETLEIL